MATPSQNRMNSKKPKDNTSGFKGVSLFKKTKKWKPQITVNKKHINLGYFDSREEAYKAYCEACVKYFGNFARVN